MDRHYASDISCSHIAELIAFVIIAVVIIVQRNRLPRDISSFVGQPECDGQSGSAFA